MKRHLLLLFACILSTVLRAEEITVDGIKYEIDPTEKTATVAKNKYFSGDLVVPSSILYNDETYNVLSIGAWAFDCADVKSAVISDGVKEIAYSAFFGCSNMVSITLPPSITSIGGDAFVNCKKLVTVYITDLEAWLNINFAAQESNPLFHAKDLYLNGEILTDLVIPSNITTIGNYVFTTYSNLTSLAIHEEVTSIGDAAFSGCKNLSALYIPNKVISIGSSAFGGCTGVTSLHIGERVKRIGRSAFSGCTGLDLLVVPNSVTWIGASSFYKCSNIKKIYLGKAVTTIDPEAFQYCSSMEDFYSFAEEVPALVNNSAFWMSSIVSATLHVPASLLDSYKQSPYAWTRFGSIVSLTDEETSVKTISIDNNEQTYYSLNGQTFTTPHRGIVIVKSPNGITKKTIVK